MNLSIATDFNGSTGSPKESLRAIAEAGFTHLHWCHHWCTDFLYSRYEIAQIRSWLREFGLKLLDIHGSQGQEKLWYAEEEYRRRSGVELVLNRAHMLRELDGEGVLMMHIPFTPLHAEEKRRAETRKAFAALCRSIDEMASELDRLQVVIAVENMADDSFDTIRELMDRYPADLLGITYDSGHGNFNESLGVGFMEPLKNRLRALHLHDNDSSGDQHQPPFYGNIDWDKLAALIAESSYGAAPVSFEMSMRNTPFFDPELRGPQGPENVKKFLADAYRRCEKFARMVEDKRKNKPKQTQQ